jgi:hypothetical protein
MKNIKTYRIYKSLIVTIMLCGLETLFFLITEEHVLRMFEERELSKMPGPKGKKVIGDEKMVLRLSNQEGKTGGAFSRYGREEFNTAFWSKGPKQDNHLEGLDVDGRTILILNK